MAGVCVLSGMRPTGELHIGHLRGVLNNWLQLQQARECYFFAADWHALTTDYADPARIRADTRRMIAAWLAAGIEPARATVFVQSDVPEHAELFLLLAMVCPLGWLERIPSYRDQKKQLAQKDLSTYGFLGYPLLQAADILMYRAEEVPVGEDQVAHVEFTREVARRFNHLYGRDAGFEKRAEKAAKKLGGKKEAVYRKCREEYQTNGNEESLAQGRALLDNEATLSGEEKECLRGYLSGGGRVILPEPAAALTLFPKTPGLDGRKMSKSYNNTIGLTEEKEAIWQKIRVMPTDPGRVKKTDKGDPNKCPVWSLHQIHSSDDEQVEVEKGCRSAGIGCVDCKKILSRNIDAEIAPIRERFDEIYNDATLLDGILADGAKRASARAHETMEIARKEVFGGNGD